jgi:hypothetical protein
MNDLSKASFPRPLLLIFVLLFTMLSVACGEKGSSGDVGQTCFPNDTCNSGLKCVNGYCVPAEPPAPAPGNTTGDKGSSGDDKAASAGTTAPGQVGDTVTKKPSYPASFTSFETFSLAKGDRWVYRYTRDKKSANDGSGEAYYYVERKVTGVSKTGSRATYTLEERGGPHDEHVRKKTLTVDDTCVKFSMKKGKMEKVFCLADGTLTDTTRDDTTFKIASHSFGKKRVTDFDPVIGIVKLEQPGWGKRMERWDLIGYSVGPYKGGDHAMVPLRCDWDDSQRLTLPEPGGKTLQPIKLSGKHGFKQVIGWLTLPENLEEMGDGIGTAIFGDGGARFITTADKTHWTNKRGMRLYRVKSWLASDNSAEYTVLHFEDLQSARVDVYRHVNGRTDFKKFMFSKGEFSEPYSDRFASLMKAKGKKCILRLSWKVPRPAKYADFAFDDAVASRIGGNLNVQESPTRHIKAFEKK